MKRTQNPLSGKAYFDKEGNLFLEKGIKFGGQLKPSVRPREWFYLLLKACEEKGTLPDSVSRIRANWTGSRTTEWRLKKALIEKGYL